MPTQRCSLRTIAKACNCSVATVSMALREMARVPVEKRIEIQQAAAAMGYVRDVEMSRLMSRARRSVPQEARETFVFLSESPIGPKCDPALPWLNRMFQQAQKAARFLGYEFEAVQIRPDRNSQQKLSRNLRTRGIRGLLIGPVTTWHPAELSLDWKHFACVEIGSTLEKPALHRVERGFYDDLLDTYAHLYRCGYRRVGLALPGMRLDFMRHMPEAALLYFEQNHPDMQHITPMHEAHEWSFSAFKRWLTHQKPDVLLVYEPDVTDWLRRLKIRAPRDLGVFYLNAINRKQSGLMPDVSLMIHEAIHLLARTVESGEYGIPQHVRSHRFRNIFNRGTTVAKKKSKKAMS